MCLHTVFRYRLIDARINAGYPSVFSAATSVPFSQETIYRHERGDPLSPFSPDKVLIYSDEYGEPQLLDFYCRDECPIGKRLVQQRSRPRRANGKPPPVNQTGGGAVGITT